MNYLEMAIQRFGFEDPRTITIAVLLEGDKMDLVRDLWATLTEEEE